MESNNENNLFGLNHVILGESSAHEFFLVPGICLSGEMFAKTYDPSGISWTDYLVEKGFRVHILDWQNFHPPEGEHFGESISFVIDRIIKENGKPCTLVTHSTSGAYGWKVLETSNLLRHLVALAPAPPGNIQNVFKVERVASEIVFKSGEYTYRIDPVKGFKPDPLWVQEKLVAHAPKFPTEKLGDLLDICKPCDPRAIMERFNASGSQLTVREDALSQKQTAEVFVVTGDFDPPHPYNSDNGTVDYLKGLGIGAEFVWLADYELGGHGHMFTVEEGSLDILKLVLSKLFPTTGAQDMGISTEAAFRGEGDFPAVIKTYRDSVAIFSKTIAERLGYGGLPTQYESLADFGSFSGGFLSNLLEQLLAKNISFKKVYALEINEEELEKNVFATDRLVTDLTDVSAKDNQFDVSTARYVLQWNSLERQEKIIGEIARTTKSFAVLQHPAVELTGQLKFHELFKGKLISSMKRIESFYSTKEEIEAIFNKKGLKYEAVDTERINDVSDIFIERYGLDSKETGILKAFLSSDDWWNRITWVIWK